MQWMDREPGADAFEVKVSELLVATVDESDRMIDNSVPQVLKLLRDHMKMDVVFVSEFTGGQRVFRHVEQAQGNEVIAEGGADPLEASWCQRVVDGRLPELIPDASPFIAAGKAPGAPFPIGTHLSTPIVLENGDVYGTLCCFSFGVNDGINDADLKKLRYSAQLTAQKIDRGRKQAESMTLEPIEEPDFRATDIHPNR